MYWPQTRSRKLSHLVAEGEPVYKHKQRDLGDDVGIMMEDGLHHGLHLFHQLLIIHQPPLGPVDVLRQHTALHPSPGGGTGPGPKSRS